jgi:hypothetical protein
LCARGDPGTVAAQGELNQPQAAPSQILLSHGTPVAYGSYGTPCGSKSPFSDIAAMRTLGLMAIEHERARHAEVATRHEVMTMLRQSELAIKRERQKASYAEGE